MKLVVFSHKPCWRDPDVNSGFATDGGFPFQMNYLSQLFDSIQIVVPVSAAGTGGAPLTGRNLQVLPLTMPDGQGLRRKLALVPWLVKNAPALLGALRNADAVHVPIPGDIGTIGMLLALFTRKALFVRHCGNWFVQRTLAEQFWRWSMEAFSGGRNIMMATGGSTEPPCASGAGVTWIFSSSLTETQLESLARMPRREPGQSLRLITVARQEPGKGTDIMLRALQMLDGAVLDVVGGGSALAALRQSAESLGVANRVILHGKQPHSRVLELLQGADVFCHITASEGFPKAVLEALASGLPVVTTPVSVLPILVRGAGVILSSPTAEAAAEAIRSCTDPQVYRALSERARLNARQYSLEKWRDEIGRQLRTAWGPLTKAEDVSV